MQCARTHTHTHTHARTHAHTHAQERLKQRGPTTEEELQTRLTQVK